LVLAGPWDREVDLQERVRVAVEDRGRPVLLEERDVLEPVDVLAGRRLEQVDVLDQRDVLLVREPVPCEELRVDRLDLLGLGVGEIVAAHRSTECRSAMRAVGLAASSSSALIASNRWTSERISRSVCPTVYVVPASGTRAIADASTVSAARSSGSSEWTFVFPHARASICSSMV